jgi:hypothetical protein
VFTRSQVLQFQSWLHTIILSHSPIQYPQLLPDQSPPPPYWRTPYAPQSLRWYTIPYPFLSAACTGTGINAAKAPTANTLEIIAVFSFDIMTLPFIVGGFDFITF